MDDEVLTLWDKTQWKAWRKQQADCPAHIRHLAQVCGDIFEVSPKDHDRDVMLIRRQLPFPGLSSCEQDYSACAAPVNDSRLLACAQRLEVKHVWVNKLGVQQLQREAKSEMSWLYNILGLSIT